MANKKVSQLVSKPSVLVTDLFPIADPTTGQLYKTTISDLGTAIGSGVSSVNTLVGAVVLDTDDIQELASPTNRWFTDTRARAAVSASSPLAYNSGTGVFSIPAATSSQNGYLTSTDWTTFNAKQSALSGTGFVKISGTTISYDNSTYLTTSAAASTYLALAGGTLTGALNGTSANFSGDLTLTGTNPRFYLTDSDNNPDYFISNTDGTFTVYDVTNSTSRFTIGTTGNGTFGGNLTVGQIIRSGGTSAQFLKADGSIDSSTYLTTGTAASTYLALAGGTLTGAVTGTRLTLAQNSADITLSIVNAGTGRAFSVLGTSYFSSDISFGSLSNGVLKANALGGLVLATAGTDYQAPLSGTGFVKISGSTISYDNSTYVPTSRTLTINGTALDLSADRSWTIASYSLPTATDTVLGGVKIGSGVTITSGVISVSTNYQAPLSGTGFVKISGSTISYDNSTYLTTSSASSTYLPLAGGTLTGALSGTSATFSSLVTTSSVYRIIQASLARGGLYTYNQVTGTGTDYSIGLYSEGEAFIVTGGTTTKRLTIASTGAATFSSSVTATQVGVNTTTPNAVLEVAGTSANTDFRVSRTVSSSTYFYIKAPGGSPSASTMGVNGTDVMTLNASGNVGIGTTSPSFATGNGLSVTAGATDTRITLKNTASGDTSTDGFQLVLTTALEAVVENRENASLRFSTNATEAMRITAAGNVLIGKTTGTSKFAVVGLPTSATGLASGDFYQSAGVVMVVP